jgi:hypothetical protein
MAKRNRNGVSIVFRLALPLGAFRQTRAVTDFDAYE